MRSFFSAVWLLLSLKCVESSRYISEGLDRELTKVEEWAVRLHFITCRSCRHFRKSMDVLREATSRLAEASEDQLKVLNADVQLSSEARERIAKMLESHQ